VQEEQLRVLVDEFSGSGKRAYRCISNALPGGFSVSAIRKAMARLSLSLEAAAKRLSAFSSDDEDVAGNKDPAVLGTNSFAGGRQACFDDEVALHKSGDTDDDAPRQPAKRRQNAAGSGKRKSKQIADAVEGDDDASGAAKLKCVRKGSKNGVRAARPAFDRHLDDSDDSLAVAQAAAAHALEDSNDYWQPSFAFDDVGNEAEPVPAPPAARMVALKDSDDDFVDDSGLLPDVHLPVCSVHGQKRAPVPPASAAEGVPSGAEICASTVEIARLLERLTKAVNNDGGALLVACVCGTTEQPGSLVRNACGHGMLSSRHSHCYGACTAEVAMAVAGGDNDVAADEVAAVVHDMLTSMADVDTGADVPHEQVCFIILHSYMWQCFFMYGFRN
jgi:hypothetical protein